MAGLKLEHLYKVYPNGTKAVSDFTMQIDDREFIVFVGPSGCGKSTTLRMIAGLEDISAGELYIDDKIVNDVDPKDRDIAMVFQNYALYPHMTVYENMAFGLKLRHVPNAEIHEKVLWAAKVLDLTEYLDRKPKAMSGGQRQRVALGRAILRNPKVMLLDEPLSNLDAKLRTQMRSEIAKLHDQLKTTFIYVTHDQVEAMTLGTRVVVMKLGKIMQIDTPKNLYDYPNNLFVAGFIGTPQMNFFHATLNRVDEDICLDFKWSDRRLTVPQRVFAKIKPRYFDGKTEVIVGIRCEDLSLDPEKVSKSKYHLYMKISHFEELGNETLIYADINDSGDGFTETNTRVIVKGRSNYGLQKGQIVPAAVNVEKIHMFDSKTEETINPRLPEDNLLTAEIKNNLVLMGDNSINLPQALRVIDGKYDLLIPIEAVLVNKAAKYDAKVKTFEVINGTNLCGLEIGNQLLFAKTEEPYEVGSVINFDIDFTVVEFQQNGQVVQQAIQIYDKINSMFINYESTKQFVGDKYKKVIDKRISDVREKFDSQLTKLKKKFDEEMLEAEKVDSASVSQKNKAILEKARLEAKQEIEDLTKQYKGDLKKSLEEHTKLNAELNKRVNAQYDKIRDDEMNAFNLFKQINKDKDVYRKRLQELNEFKANQKLERKNELEKQANLEVVRYESENNAIKGAYKRKVAEIKNKYKELVNKCNALAYPTKVLTREYKNNLKEINANYQKEINLANIIFFFKTNDLITMATDEIANKMIQGLGVKVFTKQYMIDIPHDAYELADDGIEVDVLEGLDYGIKKFIHCSFDDGYGKKDLYILTNDLNLKDKKLKIRFDIKKIHITEKSMDIKLY